MASGSARGRLRTTTTAMESRKMAVILQIIAWQRHEALVHRVLFWHWTFMLWSIDTCQNRISAEQYHVTISRAQVYNSWRSRVFLRFTLTKCCFFDWMAGSCQVNLLKTGGYVRKPVNTSPGLKFIRIITDKTQIKILSFPSWVSLIRHWTAPPRSYAFRLAYTIY